MVHITADLDMSPSTQQPMSQPVQPASIPPPIFVRIPLIQASALVAELVTYPIDLIKTRFQVSAHREGYGQIFRRAVKTDGVAGLYKGIQPAVIRHWIYTASRVLIYEDLRNALAKQPWTGGDANNPTISVKMMAGLSAGAIGQLIASPADLVKIRLQTDSKTYGGFVNAVRMIYRQEGLVGFYCGWRPNVTRAALVNLGELATYDQVSFTTDLVCLYCMYTCVFIVVYTCRCIGMCVCKCVCIYICTCLRMRMYVCDS
eukprot:m.59292 g.59292  ORF g.59292 m.59292 type:complete len:259 (+) comp22686_c0_seq1:312-1088(+)